MTDVESTGTAVVNVEEEIAKQLASLRDRVGAPPSNKITTKGKKFALPSGQTSTGPLKVVILDWRWVMANYPGVYNPTDPKDPDCFAVGINKPESGMLIPHESIENPHGANCADCKFNQWGSDPNGRGKKCKNQLRLLVMAPDADDDTEPLTIYVSPTALKNFFAYATELASVHGLDMIQVITNIGFDVNVDYPKLTFEKGDPHANLNEMWALKQRFQAVVERPIEMKHKRADAQASAGE